MTERADAQRESAPRATADAAVSDVRRGAGTGQIEAMLRASRVPDPAVVAALVAENTGDEADILALLHTTLGNA